MLHDNFTRRDPEAERQRALRKVYKVLIEAALKAEAKKASTEKPLAPTGKQEASVNPGHENS